MTDDDKELCESLRARDHGDCTDAAARIEALTAERDAALEQLEAATHRSLEYEAALLTEGERRATAAIVAWLVADQGGRGLVEYRDCWNIAAMIERNDHLNPLDT